MMKWRTLSVALIVALALVLSISGASADSGAATLTYIIFPGGFVIPTDPPLVLPPNIATADNGDTIEIVGAGTITLHPKSATGGGTFIHFFAGGGSISGTWTAVELLSYDSYGAPDPSLPFLPPGSESGRALIRVHLAVPGGPEADAVLTVTCILPNVKVPPSADEGVRLNVQDLLNFNKEVSGATLFIRTA